MFDKIAPGSQVTVKVVKPPSNAAAFKTLVRVLSKDPAMQAEDRQLTWLRKKHYTPGMRGGRLYSGRMPKIRRLRGNVGESGTIKATADVINDLKSVSRFIEVTSA